MEDYIFIPVFFRRFPHPIRPRIWWVIMTILLVIWTLILRRSTWKVSVRRIFIPSLRLYLSCARNRFNIPK